MASRLRSPMLIGLTVYQLCILFGWFVLELIIHSEPQADATNTFNAQLVLAEQTLQLFMYTGLLSFFSLSGCWFGETQRTKAGRAVAVTVGTFCKSMWLYELWYIISTYDTAGNVLNWYCGGGPYYGDVTSTSSDWCALARTVATFAALAGLGLLLLWIWGLINRFARIVPDVPIPTVPNLLPSRSRAASNAVNAAHNQDISWRTILTHPEDIEQGAIVAAYPAQFGPIRARTNRLASACTFFLVIDSIGLLLMTYPSIAFSNNRGLQAWLTSSYTQSANSGSYEGWGDPILAYQWYWLMLTLGSSFGLSAYADGRSNRSVTALACTIAFLSAAQFWSFFIYSARRLHASFSDVATTSILQDNNAQYAEIAGAGLLLIGQTLMAFTLLVRYFTYLPITAQQHAAVHNAAHLDGPTEIAVVQDTGADTPPSRIGASLGDEQLPPVANMFVPGPRHSWEDGVPSYNRSALSGVSPVMRLLCVVEVLVLLAWWLLQLVTECESSVFSSPAQAQAYLFNERMFLLCSVLGAVSLLPALYAERRRASATAVASCLTSALMLAAWFILVWPWMYQSIHSGGALYDAACVSSTFCHLTRASAVLAVIQGFVLLAVLIHTALRPMVLEDQRTSYADSGAFLSPSVVVWLLVLVAWIWAFTTIAITVKSDQVGFFQQFQTANTPNSGVGTQFTEGYWASQAFLLLAIMTLAVWSACYAPALSYAWQAVGWRAMTVGSSVLLVASTLPMIIFACRFAQVLSLSHSDQTLVAVFILLALLAVALLAGVLLLAFHPLYRMVLAPPLPARPTTVVTQQTAVVDADKNLKSVTTTTTSTSVAGPYTTAMPVRPLPAAHEAEGQV